MSSCNFAAPKTPANRFPEWTPIRMSIFKLRSLLWVELFKHLNVMYIFKMGLYSISIIPHFLDIRNHVYAQRDGTDSMIRIRFM